LSNQIEPLNQLVQLIGLLIRNRDIKPDNIMLNGCKDGKKWVDDDLMWSDGKECTKAVEKGRFKAVLADCEYNH
jgi:hypothetical protein